MAWTMAQPWSWTEAKIVVAEKAEGWAFLFIYRICTGYDDTFGLFDDTIGVRTCDIY